MKSRVPLSRRQLLQAMLATGGLWLADAGAVRPRSSNPRSQSPHLRLVNLVPHRESARAIGQRFLSGHPEEADATTLEHRITEGFRRSVRRAALDDGELRRWLSTRVRQDFAEDRVITIEGWILSLTEVRLCALVALPVHT